MPFDNSLKNLQTPERVRALCQLVEYGSYTKDEVCQMIQPRAINNSQDTVKQVLSFAIKGKMVLEGPDQKLTSGMPSGTTAEPVKFRRFINNEAKRQTNLLFHRFTAWALGNGQDLLSTKADMLEIKFFHDVTLKTTTTTTREYNKTNITAWMTWAAYLGYGIEHESCFLVNPSRRIEEELRFATFDKDKPIPFRSFMEWMSTSIPDLDGGIYHALVYPDQKGSQNLSYAVSAGLRTLHTQGMIQLVTMKDAGDVWYLTESNMHEISSAITDIIIKVGEPA